MELAIALAGLAGQLVQVGRECSIILQDAREIGDAHNSLTYELRMAGLRLKEWEEGWGLNRLDASAAESKQPRPAHSLRLDPAEDKHRHAVECLAMIVASFTKIVQLQSNYKPLEKNGSEKTMDDKPYKKFLQPPRSWFRSKPPSSGRSQSPQASISSSAISHQLQSDSNVRKMDPNYVGLLENTGILSNPQWLQEEISRLSLAAQSVRSCLPEYRKFHWAMIDKGKADSLVGQLRKYLDDLFLVMPPKFPTDTTMSKAEDLFRIPIVLPQVSRNANVVIRRGLLGRLERTIAEETGCPIQVVLYGTGGMGKTQLALQYIASHHTEYSSVFFVNGASEQTIRLAFTHIMQQLIEAQAQQTGTHVDYLNIGCKLGMAGKVDSSTGTFNVKEPAEEQNVIDAVKRWFLKPDNTKWLLVVDNVDDLKSFDIDDYIPASAYGGTVIITSRRPETAEQRCGINVQEMDDCEAEQLLRTCAKQKNEKLSTTDYGSLKNILHQLGNLPLALAQAGAYIYRRQYSFTRYLQEIDAHLFNSNQKWLSGKHSKSVFAAWEISYEAIKQENPEAANLLLLCAYLDHRDIPEELVEKGLKLHKNDTGLVESLECLISYSLITRDDRNRDSSFSFHPLVHQWLRYRPEPEHRTGIALQTFLMITSAIHIDKNQKRQVSNWTFERRIMPHLAAIESKVNVTDESCLKEEVRRGVRSLASVYAHHMKLDLAIMWYKRLLKVEENVLGLEHQDTLSTIHDIGSILEDQSQYDTALEWYKRALVGREKSLDLGPDHLDTLVTVHNIANVFSAEGKYDSALEWYKRALDGREKSLEPDHPDILDTVHNIAHVFSAQVKYDSALEWYRRALDGSERSLGPAHPDTLATVHNMASVFSDQQKYDIALEWYRRALDGSERSLGPDHPDTLFTVSSMASVFSDQEKYDIALEWYRRALDGREMSLGPNHPETLTTVHNMATMFSKQGKYDIALEWYRRALDGKEGSLGPDHPDTLATVHNMATVFSKQEKYDIAIEWYRRALVGREISLGSNHSETLATVQNMARTLWGSGDHTQALQNWERVYNTRCHVLGDAHPDTQNSLYELTRHSAELSSPS